jgi:heme-degrading monooxygenase HmoA
MILEHALLQVKPGLESAFEQAMREALPLIKATPGYGEWKGRLHHFYEPFPLVEHYTAPVASA